MSCTRHFFRSATVVETTRDRASNTFAATLGHTLYSRAGRSKGAAPFSSRRIEDKRGGGTDPTTATRRLKSDRIPAAQTACPRADPVLRLSRITPRRPTRFPPRHARPARICTRTLNDFAPSGGSEPAAGSAPRFAVPGTHSFRSASDCLPYRFREDNADARAPRAPMRLRFESDGARPYDPESLEENASFW